MTTTDPDGGSMALGDPQSFNRYSYVQNDPVNFVDPTGLMMWCFTYDTFVQISTMATTISHTVCFGSPDSGRQRQPDFRRRRLRRQPGCWRGKEKKTKHPCPTGNSLAADPKVQSENEAGL